MNIIMTENPSDGELYQLHGELWTKIRRFGKIYRRLCHFTPLRIVDAKWYFYYGHCLHDWIKFPFIYNNFPFILYGDLRLQTGNITVQLNHHMTQQRLIRICDCLSSSDLFF